MNLYTVYGLKHQSRTLSSSILGTRISIKGKAITIKRSSGSGVICSASSTSVVPSALLCGGVLVNTGKDGHRTSFNDTFAEKELGVTWDVDLCGELLKIGVEKKVFILPKRVAMDNRSIGELAKIAIGMTILLNVLIAGDIKGANILVDPNGRVKLADFEAAKHNVIFGSSSRF